MKLFLIFLFGSLVKGTLLFLLVLSSDFLASIPIWLEYVIFFSLIPVIDKGILKQAQSAMRFPNLLKLMAFTFGSFVAILWITGPLFRLYNWVFSVVRTGDGSMPAAPLVVFLLLGLILAFVTTTRWVKKNRATANEGQMSLASKS